MKLLFLVPTPLTLAKFWLMKQDVIVTEAASGPLVTFNSTRHHFRPEEYNHPSTPQALRLFTQAPSPLQVPRTQSPVSTHAATPISPTPAPKNAGKPPSKLASFTSMPATSPAISPSLSETPTSARLHITTNMPTNYPTIVPVPIDLLVPSQAVQPDNSMNNGLSDPQGGRLGTGSIAAILTGASLLLLIAAVSLKRNKDTEEDDDDEYCDSSSAV